MDISDHTEAEADEPVAGMALPRLHHIGYCSRAAAGIDDAAVALIIQAAQRNNARHGITGLLVFGGGMFFQWLEGPRVNVRRLMDIIKGDPRHESVVELSETEEVRERLFPDWAMELVTPDDIREVLLDAQESAGDAQSVEALGAMLAQLDSGLLAGDVRD
jgi:hypothetical protein